MFTNSNRSFILISICLAFLAAPQIVNACACYSTATVLDDFESADMVVIARMLSIEKAPDGKGAYASEINSATMVVEKVYKGDVKTEEKLKFAQGDPVLGCTWSFWEQDIGHRYLLYLYKPEKASESLHIGTCDRSRDLEYANDDLLYLNNIERNRARTRISGRVDFDTTDDVSSEGQVIRILGRNKTYRAVTDKNGVYEIYDLPPGRYVLEPVLKFGWKVDEFRITRPPTRLENMRGGRAPSNRVAFTLRRGKHFGVDIRLDLSNHVSGTVHDSKSEPMESVCVSLAPANAETFLVCNDLTDEFGRFRFDAIEAGSYVIILNHENKITAEMPFPRLYYPGVAEREKAKTITVKHGESVEQLDFVIVRRQ